MTNEITTRVTDDVTVQTSKELAETIPDEAVLAVSGFGSVGYPKAIPRALAESGRDLALTIVSGGSVGAEIDTALVEAGAIARRYPYQARSAAREQINNGRIAFHDRHISRLGDEVALGQLCNPEVAIVEAVAVGPDWVSPTTSIGQTPAFIERADHLIVEVNDAQPLALHQLHDLYRPASPPNRKPIPLTAPDGRIGSHRIQFDEQKLAGVVRTNTRDTPYTFREPTPVDQSIADNLAAFLAAELDRNAVFANAVHLQFGVGSVGNALMGALSAIDFGDRDVHYFGEVIQDGILDSIDAGLLSGASATSLALSKSGQNQLFDNIERYADHIVLRPADISNNPALIERFGVIGVNSALEVDIYGQVNSTHVGGTHVKNGIGGSGDFNRHALISITALPSTAADGAVSRIVPMVTHVDHTEHDVDVVVTEHGVADLRGLVPTERANKLINECAAPTYREALCAYQDRAAVNGGQMPHDLSSVFDWQPDGPGT